MDIIIKKEVKSYFYSPIGYVYLALFYFISGIYFFDSLTGKINDIQNLFSGLFTLSVFSIPLLTMRLLSEEQKNKTDQVLLTAPIHLYEIVFGKYMGALLLYVMSISITIIYAIILAIYSDFNWIIYIGHFVGILLLGSSLIAIGLFISALTENQIVAAIGGVGAGFFILLIDGIKTAVPIQLLSQIIGSLSFNRRYEGFTNGLLNIGDVIFFISISGVFLFMTIRVLEKRRWG